MRVCRCSALLLAMATSLASIASCGGATKGSRLDSENGSAERRAEPDPDGGPCKYQEYAGSCQLVVANEEVRPSSCGDRNGEIRALYRPAEPSWVPPNQVVEVNLTTGTEDHRAALRLIRKQEQVSCSLRLLSDGTCAPELHTIELEMAPQGWSEAEKHLVPLEPWITSPGPR